MDAQYFASLSSDAIPRMVDAFNNEAYPADTREQIGAALACQNERLRFEAVEPYRNRWPSFNLADWKARQALEVNRNAISQYQVRSDDYSTTIVLPDGEEFYCQMNMGFD